jgi:hypothetical protein
MFLFFFSSTFLLFEFGASFDNGFDSIGCLVFLFWRFLSPFPSVLFLWFGCPSSSAQLSSQSQQLCQHSFVGIRFFG